MHKNRSGLIGTALVVLTLCGCFSAPTVVRAEESNSTESSTDSSTDSSTENSTENSTEPASAAEGRAPDTSLVVTGRAGTRTTGSAATGRPGLDALLHLPSGYLGNGGSRPVAGASEPEWRRRFRTAEEELAAAQSALASTRQELDGVAEEGGANQWAVAPPGSSGSGNTSSSPLSFKLRQALVRDRERVEGSQKALRELRIEADLAGVPATWRSESGTVEQGAASSPGTPSLP